ncbi:MAG TPA: DUF475 domain-containing protein [Candidatus Saccharimonadales bacterium]|nr:DUF475 domain-containing protein [Candidatus Saccharimonadales bacterium]
MFATLLRSPSVRIFLLSSVLTVAGLIGVGVGMGLGAAVVAVVLIAVEIAFSFDNAILNAKILHKMSPFWQRMFLTVGAAIAIFGMRIIFPILVVSVTSGLSWHQVLQLALHQPEAYAHKLEASHVAISSFGGAFLLVLALDFFVDDTQQVMWLTRIERSLKKLATHWAPPLITCLVVVLVAMVPANHDKRETIVAGLLGIAVYSLLHGLTEVLGRVQRRSRAVTYTGGAALLSFLYLEVLDASFSFDGVIGAFAITNRVVLIAIGLGIGALWVRSLTVFMVHHRTLSNYRFIEHGAHYTILVLAVLLFVSIFYDVPEVLTGVAGLGIIASSIVASRQATR